MSDRTVGPNSDAVAIHLHAVVHGLGGTATPDPTLRIHVYYQRDSSVLVALPSAPEGISIKSGITTQPVLVDIAPCLADAQHATVRGQGCDLTVALVLLLNGVVADSESERASQLASPGSTLNLATITLTAPTAVVLSTHTAQLFANGAPLGLSAAVYDSLMLLPNHTITWTSSSPAVASVTRVGPDSVTVTPLSAGSTVIKASAGGVSDSALITVVGTNGTVRIGLSRTAVTETYALSLGTNPSSSVINVTDSGTAPLSGLSVSSVVYAPSGGPKSWLAVALGATTAPTNISLSLTPNKLAPQPPVGTYTATFQVRSPVASNSPRTVVVTLVVTAGPSAAINLSGSAVTDTFALSLGTNPSPSTITVTDGGALPLTGLSLGAVSYSKGASGWLSATLGASTAPTKLTISATPNKLPVHPSVGTYTATFTVVSPVASNSPQTVAVTLVVTPGPSAIIDLSRTAVTDTFALSLGTNPSPLTITVTDGGALPLTGLSLSGITYSKGASDWLSAKLGASTAPTNVTLSFTPNQLPVRPAVGTYTGTFTVASSVASNSPRTVVVTLVVTPGPLATIDLSATGATEQLTLINNDPAPASIAVTDGGQLPLTGLTVSTPTYAPATLRGWLAVSVGSNAPTSVTMTPEPVQTKQTLLAGTYTATFQVSASNASNSPRTIVDTMIVTPAATGLSQAVFYDTVYNANPTSPPPIFITVIDSGGAPLTGLVVSQPTYSPSGFASSGWIQSESINNTTAPATITITPQYPVNQSLTFAAGNYTATLQIVSPVAGTRTITINLYVSDLGVIF